MAEPMLCTQCGTIASSRQITPGSGLITLVLLICFMVPGIIYWLWRHTNTYPACPKCGSRSLVPTETPHARHAISQSPAVAESLATWEQGQNDMVVGGIVLAGIVGVIVLLLWLSSLK